MNRLSLVITLFTIAACATPSLEPNQIGSAQARTESVQAQTESVQAKELAGDELLASNDPAENSEGIESIEAPNISETPADMIPGLRVAEPEIVCTREVPTGRRLAVEVCRRLSDIARRQDVDRKLFEKIKYNTAVGASRL